jgi:hypothetical protein
MMSSTQPPAIDHGEVQQQIDKIVSSSTFAGKGQLIRLLRILFENMDSTTLKPDRVIRGLWPEETKTKTSADVATEMNRLRKALECYCVTEGSADTVLIVLPNRAASSDGVREKRWMIAEPRVPDATSPLAFEAPPASRPNRRRPRFVEILVAAILLLIAGLFLAGLITRDRRPYAARLEGSTLIITNQKGDELWRKSFSDGLWQQYYDQGGAQRTWFGDLNGNGEYEVLFSYHPAAGALSHSSILICYSGRGREIWRWEPGRVLPELEADPATFKLMAFGVLKGDAQQPERIVALSTHNPWAPSQVAILDPEGRLLSEYWHSGHLDYLTLADLDGNGREEIIVSGTSNGYHQATMVVLDANQVHGASLEAARPEIQIHGMGPPHERVRLLFHRSDLSSASVPHHMALESTVRNGHIRVRTEECRLQPYCDMWYEFDNLFQLFLVEPSDVFRMVHDDYYRKETNPHHFGPEEAKEFERVRCLVGCPGDYVAVNANIKP